MIKPTCARCGSDNVVCDAHAIWDSITEQWVLDSIDDDDVTCGDCGSVTSPEWNDDEEAA